MSTTFTGFVLVKSFPQNLEHQFHFVRLVGEDLFANVRFKETGVNGELDKNWVN